MQSLYSNTTASNNTAIGHSALFSNTTASNAVAVGYQALYNASGAHAYNTAIGTQALYSQDSNGGESNTAVGYRAFYLLKGGAGIAQGNTAVGSFSGQNLTGAGNNNSSFFGAYAGQATTSGTANTFIGNQSAYNNTTGSYNVVVGQNALLTNTTGHSNVAVGYRALDANTTATYNTAVGYWAGFALTTGANNVCIGMFSGYGNPVGRPDITTGSSNVYIGGYASPSASSNTYEISIGYNTAGKGAGTAFISAGGGPTYNGANTTTWATTSDRRLKKNIVDNNTGLDKITAIQVRDFEYRSPEEVDAELKPSDAIQKSGVQLGVIAQELQQVLPECVRTESTGVMSVDADNLTWYMVNAIKELKAEIDSLKSQLNQGA
jgi:hypothetical protein